METNTETQDSLAAGTDILDFNSAEQDRNIPLLREQIYDFEIAAIEDATNDKTNKRSIKITLKTTQPSQFVTGDSCPAGWPVYHYLGLTPTDKFTPDMIKRNCVLFLDAVFGKNTNEPMKPIERMVGRIVRAKTENRKEQNGFPPSTGVKTWEPAPKQ